MVSREVLVAVYWIYTDLLQVVFAVHSEPTCWKRLQLWLKQGYMSEQSFFPSFTSHASHTDHTVISYLIIESSGISEPIQVSRLPSFLPAVISADIIPHFRSQKHSPPNSPTPSPALPSMRSSNPFQRTRPRLQKRERSSPS
jgi:hypothetical protein